MLFYMKPLLSLIFGNLTEQFVQFAQVVTSAADGNSEDQARVSVLAAGFRATAAVDASYLAYIGELPSGFTFST